MPEYPEHGPIAVGVEVLCDRWTPLVIRELMIGSSGFNEIHRGIPRISRTLLSQRLRTMERRGVVTREAGGRGKQGRYALTPAGEALTPIVWSIGHWAAEWRFADSADEELDGLSLIWTMHRRASTTQLPTPGTVVHVLLAGRGAAEGWLVAGSEGMTACRDDPGFDLSLALQADSRAVHRWLLGLVDFRDLERAGDARLLGPSELARDFSTWFETSLVRAPSRW